MLTPTQRDERVLIVWSDDIDNIVPLCADFEEKLMKLVWRSRTRSTHGSASVITAGSIGTASATASVAPSTSASTTASDVNLASTDPGKMASVAEAAAVVQSQSEKATAKKGWGWSWKLSSKKSASATKGGDPEKGANAVSETGREARPIRLFAPIYGGLGAGLSFCKSSFLCVLGLY
jgi:hypothetical protein